MKTIGFVFAIQSLAVASLVSAPLASPDTWQEVEPLLVEYCFNCHDSLTAEGEFDLEILSPDFSGIQSAQHWIEVMDNLNASEMPPENEKQPTEEDRALITGWINDELEHALTTATATGGRSQLRRLTRAEYENTVKDLLGVVFEPGKNPSSLLPPDGTHDGFTKVSRALLLDPSLLDQYFTIATEVANLALQPGDPPVPTVKQRMEAEEYDLGITLNRDQNLPRYKTISPDGSGVITWTDGWRTFGTLRHPYNNQLIPVSGKYAIRFRAGADRGEDGKPVLFRVTRQGEGDIFFGEIDAPIDSPKVYEIVMDFDAEGGGELGLRMVEGTQQTLTNRYEREKTEIIRELSASGNAGKSTYFKSRLWAEGAYGMGRPNPETREPGNIARVYLDYVEIEGPLYEQWPPKSMETLFPSGLTETEKTKATLRKTIATLLPSAYRRPVSEEEIDRVFRVAETWWQDSGKFERGVKAAIVTTLCSPDFLYIMEPGPEGRRPLTSYELASRLSYFLWGTMPDQKLFLAAREETLNESLTDTVDRMLEDPKAEALITGFASEWLKAREFDRFEPDKGNYRNFYANEFNGLNEDMNHEPLEFVREIIRSDGDLRDLLNSDWTMVNRRLARWYGIPENGLTNDNFQRVSLPGGNPRGGLLGMGAIHKWGSDGSRTKPVDRGKYVLEVLFNDPPPPPPPNVDEVEPNVEGERLTVRQRLEKHRSIESCANCHSRLDPYGLAMENFGVVSQWRDFQDGENQRWGESEETRIDAGGTLPNGSTFTNFLEYKNKLRAMDERFFLGFSEKLFTYAVNRPPEPIDRPVINAMVRSLTQSGGQFKAAVHTLIASEPFQTK